MNEIRVHRPRWGTTVVGLLCSTVLFGFAEPQSCAPPATASGGAGGGTGGSDADGTSSGSRPSTSPSSTTTVASTTSATSTASTTASTTVGGSTASSGSSTAGSIAGCPVFLPDSPWNTDISGYPVHPDSDTIVDAIGRTKHAHPDFGSVYGIPYVVVPGTQPTVPVSFDYASESDPGPYPIPPDAPVEGSSDSHVLAIDQDACVLYELYGASTTNGGASWHAGSGAIWDLTINATRPDGWTSADAAGLPIFPGLARYDEIVTDGVIRHALRFTVSHSRAAYIAPATHFASSDTSPSRPAMGMRFRMKQSYDCSGFSQETQVVCTALKTYGMIVADNGSDWYISGAPNPSFDDDALGDIKIWTGDAFEVVYTGDPTT